MVLRESLKIKILKNIIRKKSEIQTALALQPQSLFKKKSKNFERLWQNKHVSAGDGTTMRSGDLWKPVNQTIKSNNQ